LYKAGETILDIVNPLSLFKTTRPKSKWAFINKMAELEISLEGAESIEQLTPADGLPARVTLSDEERDYFGIKWGELNRTILEPLIKPKGFSSIPEAIQKDIITTQLLQNREIARDMTVAKYPRILSVGITDNINKTLDKTRNIPGIDVMKRFTQQPPLPPTNQPLPIPPR